MTTHAWRTAVSAVAVAAILAAACPAAFGALEIVMEFTANERPTHMMSMMGMMGMDMWAAMLPTSMMMFVPADYDQIHITTQMPAGKRVEVDASCNASLSGALSTMGMVDEWVTSRAVVSFLGVQGRAPSVPTTAKCLYAKNGEAITWEINGFTFPSSDVWSFTGVDLLIDITGLDVRVAKQYSFVDWSFNLVEPNDSGQAFSLVVPEPATVSLLVLGASGVLLRRRK